MNSFPSAKIRNVALVGHGGAGKTTLAEALLFTSGAINRQGRVEDGTSTCDFDAEEVKRHISVATALAAFEYEGFKINLLDCPGYADFLPEVEAALQVADLAVFVVSAVEGVEVQTEIVWKIAERLGLPRLIFVNKEDRERADFERVLAQLQDVFGRGVAPLELPIGEEAAFHGVADLLTDTAIVYDDDQGHHHDEAIPAELADHEHEVHDQLVEGIVEADDTLMERYLEGEVPSTKELEDTLAKGVLAGTVFPVICGSALKDVAVDQLAKFICEIGPSPLERPPATAEGGGDLHEVACDPDGQPLAYVWKTVVDRHVGKISLFKVLSGTIRPDTVLANSRSHGDERLHSLFTMLGKDQIGVNDVPAGDLAAVAKLSDTRTGDTLAPKGTPVSVSGVGEPPVPSLTIAIAPKSKGDEDKLMTSLHRLQDEDSSLFVRRDDETHQTLLSGMGETHLAIVVERLARKFGVEVLTEEVRVPYRETITSAADAEGKYKKQAGGHGQFGVANITIEPLDRGSGFEFVDKIVGGAIPRQFIPAVEKGIGETMSRGGHYGHPVVDVRVTLVDGKYHSVDSSEMSFKMAGSLGFQEAMAKASPVILEPISLLEVTVPAAYQGDVMGDLNARRGRVQGTESGNDGTSIVIAMVPTSEIARYAIDLRSLTGGRGRFTVQHDHYDVLPQHLYDKVKREAAEAESH